MGQNLDGAAVRPIDLSRDEAEFIVDACEKDGAPQWYRLSEELRRIWGMVPRDYTQPRVITRVLSDGVQTKDGAA